MASGAWQVAISSRRLTSRCGTSRDHGERGRPEGKDYELQACLSSVRVTARLGLGHF
jgi:hypothetical protein